MIDVTIRLTIPNKVFTAATDNIYIAGNVNGWNSSGWLLKKPSGATEALTSNMANDTTSPGNYAYITSENPILPSVISKKTLYIGKTFDLRVTDLLDGATVTYSINKKSVATISKTGRIKAKKAGTAVITAKVTQTKKLIFIV